jgi:hypothetical protein
MEMYLTDIERMHCIVGQTPDLIIVPCYGDKNIEVKNEDLNPHWVHSCQMLILEKDGNLLAVAVGPFSEKKGSIVATGPFCILESDGGDYSCIWKFTASADKFPEWLESYRLKIFNCRIARCKQLE